MKIRTVRPDEIELRVQTIKESGCSILLYKDARCDMRILDETFGVLGWQRSHKIIGSGLFCTVDVWDSEKQQWISKEDIGVESSAAKEKGQASDSFKRACFNIGIGRELYSSPFIWIKLDKGEAENNKGRWNLNFKTKFRVKDIKYSESREITGLLIVDQNNKVRFSCGELNIKETEKPKQQPKQNAQNRANSATQQTKSKQETQSTTQRPKMEELANVAGKCSVCGVGVTQAVVNASTKATGGKIMCIGCMSKKG